MVAAIFPPSLVTAAPPPSAAPTNTHAWKDGSSFGFHDLLDLLNPLQHIPIVSSVYRWLTDDVPGNVSRILGDGLFGGPIGLVTGALSVAVKEETGKDPGEMAIALLTGGDTSVANAAAVATDPPGPVPAETGVLASAEAARSISATQPVAAPPFASTAKPGPLPAAGGAAGPEAAFLARTAAQSAMLQRSLAGQRAVSGHPVTAPVPLQLTGGITFPLPPQHRGAATEPPAASPAPAAAGAAAAPANPPAEISQRMLEALDKYMQLRQQRGSTVDLVQ